jgi:hypothetical protein
MRPSGCAVLKQQFQTGIAGTAAVSCGLPVEATYANSETGRADFKLAHAICQLMWVVIAIRRFKSVPRRARIAGFFEKSR